MLLTSSSVVWICRAGSLLASRTASYVILAAFSHNPARDAASSGHASTYPRRMCNVMKRPLRAVALVGVGLLAGAGAGVAVGIPTVSGAQTTTTTPSTGSSTATSNTDPAHEAAESPAQAAAEANGTFTGGPGGGHSNTDAAHEAAETPEHAAAEAAHDATVTTPSTTTTG